MIEWALSSVLASQQVKELINIDLKLGQRLVSIARQERSCNRWESESNVDGITIRLMLSHAQVSAAYPSVYNKLCI